MKRPLDRRKKYTQMVLKDSFMQLLKQKPVSSITVTEICELADINRSTFYAHYDNPFDLLESIEEEMLTDLTTYLNQYDYKNEEDVLHLLEKLLAYFASKKETCQTLLNEKNETGFHKKVMDVANQFFLQHWHSVATLKDAPSEYVSTFIISGAIHVMKEWLANDMDKPPGEIAEVLNQLINKGCSWFK